MLVRWKTNNPNKDYKQWMMKQTARLIENAEQSISDPAYRISGLTNKMLRQSLADSTVGTGQTDKQLSGKISRHLRLLRAHGLIRKLPKQNRYQVTLKGVRLINIVNAFWAASTEDLMKMAA